VIIDFFQYQERAKKPDNVFDAIMGPVPANVFVLRLFDNAFRTRSDVMGVVADVTVVSVIVVKK